MRRDLIEPNCDLCGGREFSVIYEADAEKIASFKLSSEMFRCTSEMHEFFFRLARCRTCSLVMVHPRLDDAVLLELASNVEDSVYDDEKQGRFITFKKSLDAIDEILPPREDLLYLDFSCYLGLFVEVLLQQGRNVQGVDICKKVVDQGNRRLGESCLKSGLMEDWPDLFPEQKFDAITSWDAIEHVLSPLDYLKTANRLLKPGGLLTLTTMNYDSLFARATGKKWPWLMPMHLYYFTPQTLKRMLELAGFQVVKRTTYSHVVSLGYLLYKINSGFLGKLRKWRALKNIFIPINFGDFMTVYAQKTE